MADLILCIGDGAPRRVARADFFSQAMFGSVRRWEVELALDQSGYYRTRPGVAPEVLVFNAPGARRAKAA